MKLPPDHQPDEAQSFLNSYMYLPQAILLDEVTRLDRESASIEARMDTGKPLPYSDLQRHYAGHPQHVAAPDLITLTGSMGCLHAWFFHGCRWDEGWAGFGNRIHRADFKELVTRGPELLLTSRETRSRVGEERVLLRYEFRFYQRDRMVYYGDQTALFVRDWFKD